MQDTFHGVFPWVFNVFNWSLSFDWYDDNSKNMTYHLNATHVKCAFENELVWHCDMCCYYYCSIIKYLSLVIGTVKRKPQTNGKYFLKTLCHRLAICRCAYTLHAQTLVLPKNKQWTWMWDVDGKEIFLSFCALFYCRFLLHWYCYSMHCMDSSMGGYFGWCVKCVQPNVGGTLWGKQSITKISAPHIFAAVYLCYVWWFANRANNWSYYKQLTNYQWVSLVVMCVCVCLCIHRMELWTRSTIQPAHIRTHTLSFKVCNKWHRNQ